MTCMTGMTRPRTTGRNAVRPFHIREEGQIFATIAARTAGAALRKAARRFPRRACDYNCELGERYEVEWYASDADYSRPRPSAKASVPVPSTGARCIRVRK